MRPARTPFEEAVRLSLVFGAIMLLVANLLPQGGVRTGVFVIGDVLVILGIIGEIIIFVMPQPKQQHARSGNHGGGKRARRRR